MLQMRVQSGMRILYILRRLLLLHSQLFERVLNLEYDWGEERLNIRCKNNQTGHRIKGVSTPRVKQKSVLIHLFHLIANFTNMVLLEFTGFQDIILMPYISINSINLIYITSYLGEFAATSCMPQSGSIFLLPVSSHSLFRHNIEIPIFEIYNCTLSNRFSFQKPLIMDWLAYSSCKTNSNHLLSLTVPMKTYPTLLNIIVIVPFCFQLFSPFEIFAQIFPKGRKQRNMTPRDYPSLSLFIIGLLGILAKAKIMTGMFGDHSSIHESLLIPIKFHKFLPQCLFIIQDLTQQTLNPPLHNQQASVLSLLLSKFVEVHKDTLVSLFFKEQLSLYQLLPRKASLCWSSDYLHALVILCLVTEGNSNRTHILYLFLIMLEQSLNSTNNYRQRNMLIQYLQ